VFIATQLNWTELNWTQLIQLNSVQPSQSCFCLWRHDLQTESTVVHAVELCEFSWVELSRVAINGPLQNRRTARDSWRSLWYTEAIFLPSVFGWTCRSIYMYSIALQSVGNVLWRYLHVCATFVHCVEITELVSKLFTYALVACRAEIPIKLNYRSGHVCKCNSRFLSRDAVQARYMLRQFCPICLSLICCIETAEMSSYFLKANNAIVLVFWHKMWRSCDRDTIKFCVKYRWDMENSDFFLTNIWLYLNKRSK